MEGYIRSVISQKIVDAQVAPIPTLTRRDVWLPAVKNKATAVIGMRRAGKTSLLWQILSERYAIGTEREGLLYFSFEDERLVGMQTHDLHLILEEYYRLNPEWRDHRRTSLFLDEIQLVPGWETFARRILDTENIELFVSGSSARLLSREVATSMRGRAMEAVVYPFSFREALRHTGQEPDKPSARLSKSERSLVEKLLLDYLVRGGFPEVQGLDGRNRRELLRTYVDVVLLRDIVERHNVSQPQALRWMVQQLLANAGGAFSINKFHADLKSRGMAISKETLHHFLGYLEDAFLLEGLTIATDSERRRQVNPRKVYPVDTGFSLLFDYSGKANTGHALETAVFLELKRRGSEVTYVRTAADYEVDFYVRTPDGEEMLIQVALELDDPAVFLRETRALLDAATNWSRATLHLITLNLPHEQTQCPTEIRLHRAVDWFLA